jgi:hypothetical protein
MDEPHKNTENMLIEAMNHLRAAIDLLDRAGAPGHIAAHADLAFNQLEQGVSTGNCESLRKLGAGDEDCGHLRTCYPPRLCGARFDDASADGPVGYEQLSAQ